MCVVNYEQERGCLKTIANVRQAQVDSLINETDSRLVASIVNCYLKNFLILMEAFTMLTSGRPYTIIFSNTVCPSSIRMMR